MSEGHTTVLLKEAVDALNLTSDSRIIDGTVGGAGHFALIKSHLGKEGVLMGIDEDTDALKRAEAVGGDTRTILVQGNFRDMKEYANKESIAPVSGILLDLGWSGFQLTGGKGLSFLANEPLLMTYGDGEGKTTAYDMVNYGSEESLVTIIRSYGEESLARKIVKAILSERTKKPIETSKELGELIEKAVGRRGKTHPATKTFQALRIAVNDELGALGDALTASKEILASKGRLAIITFHSMEDRIVKHTFLSWKGEGTVLTKKPIVPSDEEVAMNPRARSAKLRIFEKN